MTSAPEDKTTDWLEEFNRTNFRHVNDTTRPGYGDLTVDGCQFVLDLAAKYEAKCAELDELGKFANQQQLENQEYYRQTSALAWRNNEYKKDLAAAKDENERLNLQTENLSALCRKMFRWARVGHPDLVCEQITELSGKAQHLLTESSPLRTKAKESVK